MRDLSISATEAGEENVPGAPTSTMPRGDQPGGNDARGPCSLIGVKVKPASDARAPGGIVSTSPTTFLRLAPNNALTAREGASGVSLASSTLANEPCSVVILRSTGVNPRLVMGISTDRRPGVGRDG